MIPVLLSRELRVGFIGDPIAEHRSLTFELARLVFGIHPIQDVLILLSSRLEGPC